MTQSTAALIATVLSLALFVAAYERGDQYYGSNSYGGGYQGRDGDTYEEWTHETWFDRMGNSLVGVGIGFVVLIGTGFLLFWNEKRAVNRIRALKEGSGQVVSVSTEGDNLRQFNQCLIHTTGHAATNDLLSDEDFGVQVQAIKLIRSVQIYQWKETKRSQKYKNVGGSTDTRHTYTYNKVWKSDLSSSRSFRHPQGHENPSKSLFVSKTTTANNVMINGSLSLSQDFISKFSNVEKMTFNEGLYNVLPPHMQGILKIANQHELYYGVNPMNPQIGDMKITFSQALPCTVSVVGKLSNGILVPHNTSNNSKIALLQTGTHKANDMFKAAMAENTFLTWILRALGFFLNFVGFALLFSPLSTFFDILPFIGGIVGFGTSLGSLLLGFIVSIITIAVAWIFYRPIVGVALLSVAAVMIFVSSKGGEYASTAHR